jgi:hypothetical protein
MLSEPISPAITSTQSFETLPPPFAKLMEYTSTLSAFISAHVQALPVSGLTDHSA